ncbi:unnamed protein product, partial [marine sediment metagenome]
PTVTSLAFANYNSKLYLAANKVLSKLNSTGDGFDYVNDFDNNILDLTPSLGVLFIALGAEAADTRTAEALDDSETDIDIDDDTGFSEDDHIRIDAEVIKITTIDAGRFAVVVRGQWGTTAAAHSINARVLEARKSYYMDVDETFTLCNAANARPGVDRNLVS